MNISIGIFDLFTNAVPGALYLVATVYVAVRLGWVDVDDLAGLNTTVASRRRAGRLGCERCCGVALRRRSLARRQRWTDDSGVAARSSLS